jgi:hypothetical protein
MLYYAEDFSHLIQTVQGTSTCHNWGTMAAAFWHLDEEQA